MVKGDLKELFGEFLKTSSQPRPPRVDHPVPVPKFEPPKARENEGAGKGTEYVEE